MARGQVLSTALDFSSSSARESSPRALAWIAGLKPKLKRASVLPLPSPQTRDAPRTTENSEYSRSENENAPLVDPELKLPKLASLVVVLLTSGLLQVSHSCYKSKSTATAKN